MALYDLQKQNSTCQILLAKQSKDINFDNNENRYLSLAYGC